MRLSGNFCIVILIRDWHEEMFSIKMNFPLPGNYPIIGRNIGINVQCHDTRRIISRLKQTTDGVLEWSHDYETKEESDKHYTGSLMDEILRLHQTLNPLP